MNDHANAPELLPCPFCGSSQVSLSEGETGDGMPWPYVECEECAATATPENWNTRAALRRQGGGAELREQVGFVMWDAVHEVIDFDEAKKRLDGLLLATQPPGVPLDRLEALAGKMRRSATFGDHEIESANTLEQFADELDTLIREQRSNG